MRWSTNPAQLRQTRRQVAIVGTSKMASTRFHTAVLSYHLIKIAYTSTRVVEITSEK